MRAILYISILLGYNFLIAQKQLYKVMLTQAAPGELHNVIELMKHDVDNHEDLGIPLPLLMRHSQGDKWDLMMIYPFSTLDNLYKIQNYKFLKESKTMEKVYGDPFLEKISWHEESVMLGPNVADFEECAENYGFFHIEIFRSLAGKQIELLDQRKMENQYLEEIGRRPNLIFTKMMGASWDIFTIGCYQDLKDYASGSEIPYDQEDAAAKKAGFKGVDYIGSYLRELIAEHHDTLAGKVD